MRATARKPSLAENLPETRVKRTPSLPRNAPETPETSVCPCDGGCPQCEAKHFRSLRFQGDEKLKEILDGNRTLSKEGLPRGNEVAKIQQALEDLGYYLPVYGVDGIFGPETEKAVMEFQHDFGVLKVHGRVGFITMETLDDITYAEERRKLKITVPHDNNVSGFDESDPDVMGAGSWERQEFEKAANESRWEDAYYYLNGLNMSEMLKGMDALETKVLNDLWDQREYLSDSYNITRIKYAKTVVQQRTLPVTPAHLRKYPDQVKEAADFIARRLIIEGRKSKKKGINPGSDKDISLLLMECRKWGVTDRSHIAYILATAHWESFMGLEMTEKCGKCKKYDLEPKKSQLGNTDPDDGFWFRGRGYAHLTGRGNYKKFKDILGIGSDGRQTIQHIKKAAEPDIAAEIIVRGMKDGIFGGSTSGGSQFKLSKYGTDGTYDFVDARTIIDSKSTLNVRFNIEIIAKRYRKGMMPNP